MRRQVSAFLRHATDAGLRVERLLHDRDTKFTVAVDAELRASQVKVHRAPPRSPNLLAYVERFNLSIQSECLDHFIVFGERHLNYLVTEWLAHYHHERPHQGKRNEILCPEVEPANVRAPVAGAPVAESVRIRAADTVESGGIVQPAAIELSDIRCRQRRGGLLKHYHRRAALCVVDSIPAGKRFSMSDCAPISQDSQASGVADAFARCVRACFGWKRVFCLFRR